MTPEFDLGAYLDERRRLVEEELERVLPAMEEAPEARVIEAMRYSLFAGGKRLRSILCLAAAEAVGGDPRTVLGAACALEMIHTYSLIHDDLPCMDDDELRRGIPTNHKVFGEAVAILAGDALLTEAFFLLSAPGCLPAERALQLVRIIAGAAGFRGMVGGQALDMISQNQPANLDLVRRMHERKTAALISAAVEAGALAGGATEKQAGVLARYGRAIGLAFQISDDILDIKGDAAALGKTPGADETRGKATYPAAVGLERSLAAGRELVKEALEALEGFDERAAPLRAIAEYIMSRRK